LRRILPAAGACAQTVKPGVAASKRNWGDPMRFLRWDCSLVSPCSHSSLGPDMPSASGNLTCAAVVTITMIEPHVDRRALRSVDSWAAQSLAMREAPISGATRPHFTANFGKANTSSPGDLFVPNFFGVCAGYGPVLARTYTCFFSGALPQHLPVLQHAPAEHWMIRSPGD